MNPCASDSSDELHPCRLLVMLGGRVILEHFLFFLLLSREIYVCLFAFVQWCFCWVDGLHNPGLTRLAVLLIHGRPRSMLAVSLIAPSSYWRCFISNWPHNTQMISKLVFSVCFCFVFAKSFAWDALRRTNKPSSEIHRDQ